MSLNELIGTPRYETYIAPKVNTPSDDYVAAVNMVRKASSGTVISTFEDEPEQEQMKLNTDPIGLVGNVINNILKNNPLDPFKAAQTIGSGFNIWMGTPKAKLDTIMDYINIPNIETRTINTETGEVTNLKKTDLKTATDTALDAAAESDPEFKKWLETATFANTNIEIPEIKFPDILGGLADIGKWALIAGAGLIAILVLTRR